MLRMNVSNFLGWIHSAVQAAGTKEEVSRVLLLVERAKLKPLQTRVTAQWSAVLVFLLLQVLLSLNPLVNTAVGPAQLDELAAGGQQVDLQL